MELILKCTHVTPHGDGTQTVTLSEPAPIFPPVLPTPGGHPIPVPDAAMRATPEAQARLRRQVSLLVTNWPNGRAFEVGRSYKVDISALA